MCVRDQEWRRSSEGSCTSGAQLVMHTETERERERKREREIISHLTCLQEPKEKAKVDDDDSDDVDADD